MTVDGALVFDVSVTTPPPGHIILNPGDWGSGSWYDDLGVFDRGVGPRDWPERSGTLSLDWRSM